MSRPFVETRDFIRVYDLRKGEQVSAPMAGWVYVSHSFIDPAKRRGLRRRMVRIVREDTGAAIHRRLRFAARLSKGNDEGKPAQIGLDWDSWLELLDDEENPTGTYRLRLEPSRSWLASVGLGHPDPNIHAAAILGLMGAATGVISLLASALGLLG